MLYYFLKIKANQKLAKRIIIFILCCGLTIGGVAACVQVTEPIQTAILAYDRFLNEATLIIEKLRARSGAKVAVLAVYDIDFTQRVIIVRSGPFPDMSREQVDVSIPGYREMLEELLADETFYSLVNDLPEGVLKTDLQKAQVDVLVASPVYDRKGFLIGYVAVGMSKGSSVDKERLVTYTEQAAAELSRLSGVLE